jgi:hypothetical protein
VLRERNLTQVAALRREIRRAQMVMDGLLLSLALMVWVGMGIAVLSGALIEPAARTVRPAGYPQWRFELETAGLPLVRWLAVCLPGMVASLAGGRWLSHRLIRRRLLRLPREDRRATLRSLAENGDEDTWWILEPFLREIRGEGGELTPAEGRGDELSPAG